jgi:hypothetical protein
MHDFVTGGSAEARPRLHSVPDRRWSDPDRDTFVALSSFLVAGELQSASSSLHVPSQSHLERVNSSGC